MSPADSSDGPAAERDALRMLARRPFAERELRERLSARGHEPDAVAAACARLSERGYLDDARLALEFIVLRAGRLGRGPARLIEELCRRGVRREVAESALRLAVERGELRPRELLRRRIARELRGRTALRSRREYARVYNALCRAGFDEETIRRELESLREPAPHDEPATDGTTHDFP